MNGAFLSWLEILADGRFRFLSRLEFLRLRVSVV